MKSDAPLFWHAAHCKDRAGDLGEASFESIRPPLSGQIPLQSHASYKTH